jgi:hypothetical protein
MKSKIWAAAMALVVSGCATMAVENPQEVVKRAEALPAHKALVRAALTMQQEVLGCNDVKDIEFISADIFRTPIDQNAREGGWESRYKMNACGKDELGNLFISTRGNGRAMIPMTPGDSISEPKLQNEVMPSFLLAAKKGLEECAQPPQLRRIKAKAPEAAGRPWQEVWTATSCGKDVDVPINFVPSVSPKGVTFVIEMPKK